ncbi:TIGR04084 family radical SAM/SPASM domain-containing protein [Methanococcoides sp. SA1]|nr:TIGR04084 family radical SAM/SPASM domain-containing protein [Methanococcoides sp. SA1]
MHYHIILTEKCNLQCKYCYEKSMQEFDNRLEEKFDFDYTEPCVSQVDIQKLKTFIEKDPEATIIFYGGEPLLQIDKIKQIMDNINVSFRMQTNGQLLHLLKPKYLNKITKILISIDGNQEITDKYRGKGAYQKIIDNIKLIKSNGYEGELIARMTVAQDNPNIHKNIQDILETKLFDSVHWQLDANFYKEDFNSEKISGFFFQYNESITKLVDFWVSEILKGNFINLYPFTGITARLLGLDKETCIMCGAGCKGYAISTSGKVVACPIMNNIKDFECGNLDSKPSELKKIGTISPCTGCEERNICGGRCLYSNHAKLWPKEGEKLVCDSIRHLIDELRKNLSEIQRAIQENKISLNDFDYEKYFGPEIIP